MGKWEKIKLGDVIKTNQLSYTTKEGWEYVNYLDTGSITENVVSDIQKIDLKSEKLPSRAKRKVKHNSIVYSTVRPNQRHYGIIKEKPDNFLVSTGFAVIDPDEELIDADFLFFMLSQDAFVEHLQAIAEQSVSAYPSIKASDIENLEVILPPLVEQKRIASILCSLSDMMRQNREINKNLEAQALLLFQTYFMAYEPYGGSAPSNWQVTTLGDVCTRITDGSHYSPKDVPGSLYPMFSVKDMEEYDFNRNNCKHITAIEFQKMRQNDCVPLLNDILVAKDGSYLKEIFICNAEREEGILSSIAIFRPNTNLIMPEILLYLLKQPSVRKDVGDNYVSGSALPRIVLKDFKKYSFILPPMSEQEKIGGVLRSIRHVIAKNVAENNRLASLRDTLLPRLMSGKLDVSNLDL